MVVNVNGRNERTASEYFDLFLICKYKIFHAFCTILSVDICEMDEDRRNWPYLPERNQFYGEGSHGALAMTTPGDTTMASKKEVETLMNGAGAEVNFF